MLFFPLARSRLASRRRRRRRRRSKSSRSFADQTWIAVLTIVFVPGQIGEYRNVSSTTTFQIRKMQAVLEASSSYKIKTLTQTLSNNTRRSQPKTRYYSLPFFLSPSLSRSISANVSFAKTRNSIRVSQSSTCAHNSSPKHYQDPKRKMATETAQRRLQQYTQHGKRNAHERERQRERAGQRALKNKGQSNISFASQAQRKKKTKKAP